MDKLNETQVAVLKLLNAGPAWGYAMRGEIAGAGVATAWLYRKNLVCRNRYGNDREFGVNEWAITPAGRKALAAAICADVELKQAAALGMTLAQSRIAMEQAAGPLPLAV